MTGGRFRRHNPQVPWGPKPIIPQWDDRARALPGGRLAMYESHFGLSRRPFRATPDIECYYPAFSHEACLAQIVRALADQEGFVLLTGEPGMGKTTLCHRLVERLGAEAVVAFLTNTHVRNRAGLLQALLFDLSISYEGRGEQELRLALTDYLLKNYVAGKPTLVLIDEAQHLNGDCLEELRLLGNLETAEGKAFQAVLVGQPEILRTLKRPELAALSQRLATRVRLERLVEDEAVDYLVHQLRAAGGRPQAIWTDEALHILARASQGVCRLLCQAAHQALTLACAEGLDHIDAEVALEALSVLGLKYDEEPAAPPESFIESEVEVPGAPEPRTTHYVLEDGHPDIKPPIKPRKKRKTDRNGHHDPHD